MKKLTSILLSILLLIAVVATSVFAAGEDAVASLSPSSVSGVPGEIVTVDVHLEGAGGTDTLGVSIQTGKGLSFSKANSQWLVTGALDSISDSAAVWTCANSDDGLNTLPDSCDIIRLAFQIKDPGEVYNAQDYAFSVNVIVTKGSNKQQTSASGAVKLQIPATKLTLSNSTLAMDLKSGETAQLTATVEPSNTTDTLAWTTSNAAVATVDNGVVTPVGVGEATITATVGELSKTCVVTVSCSHTLAETKAAESTCISKGHNAYWTCAHCGKVYKDAEGATETTVDAETLDFGSHKPSTTLTKGEATHWYECSVCEKEEGRTGIANHTYTNPQYTWADDNSKCTATATCACGATIQEVANSTCTENAASCWKNGSKTFAATFESAWATAQTKVVTIDATGNHSYGATTYQWEGYTVCTATRACTTDGCTQSETVTSFGEKITSKVTTPATCGATGVRTYTATFEDTAAEAWAVAQTATETIPITDPHSYAVTFAWDSGKTVCTATGVCGVCNHEVETTATATVAQTKDPTCIALGQKTHTATFTAEWIPEANRTQITYSDVPMEEHVWTQNGDVVWTKSDESYTCTANAKCTGTDCTATHSEQGTVTSETIAPTCYQSGKTTYTATFAESWVTAKTATKEVTLDPTGQHTAASDWSADNAYHWHVCTTSGCTQELEKAAHSYTVTFAWDSGKTVCTATGVCDVCDDKVETTATATVEQTKDPTCIALGQKTHTATFTAEWIPEANRTQITYSDVPMEEHVWTQNGDVVWTKSGESYTCTANAKCTGTDCTATHSEQGTVTSETVAPTCYQSGKTTYTATFAESWVTAKTATKEVTLDPTGQHTAASEWKSDDTEHWHACTTEGCPEKLSKTAHEYTNAVYEWMNENAKCKATATCVCGATDTETVDTTCVNTPAKCYEDGSDVFTATFTKSWAETKTVTETLPATNNHVASDVWSKDDNSHWRACTTEGCPEKLHTAQHDFNVDGGYIWTDTRTSCTVQGKCSDCQQTTVASAAKIESEITLQPTCKDEGEITYTATFQETWTNPTTVKTDVIPATENHVGGGEWQNDETDHWRICATDGCNEITDKTVHTFTDAKYQWADDHSTCTATATCLCGRTDTDSATINHVNTPAKCYEAGSDVYTATFTESWAQKQTKTVTIPATGAHIADADWSSDTTNHWHACTTAGCSEKLDKADHTVKISGDYTWSEDLSKCTVDGTCEICEQAVTANATVTSKITIQPTCKDKGERTYTATFTESWAETQTKKADVDPTNDHVGDKVWVTDSQSHWQTCTTEGCDAKVDKADHTFQWKVDKAATEDETGLKHEECTCGYKRNENTEIPKLDHVHIGITHHAAVKATCVKEGVKEHWTCSSSKCKDLYYGDKQCQTLLETIVVAVDSTNHGTLETKDALEPTCAETGYTGDAYCTVCKKLVTKGEQIAATGKHTPADKLLTNEKQHWKVCSHCEAVMADTVASHTFAWIVDKQPTEAATGLKHEQCSTCKYIRNENTVMDKLQHAPYLVAAKEATCTEDGRTEHFYCGSCGGYYASNGGKLGAQISYSDTVIPATGHSFDEKWLSDSNGHWHVCDCGEKSEPEKHKFQTVGAEEATEDKMGYTGDTVCSVCEYVSKTGEKTDAKAMVQIKNEAGEVVHAAPMLDLVITNVSEVKSGAETAISKEAAEALQTAHDALNAEDVQLSVLVPELVEAVEEKGLDAAVADELILVDLFDVSIFNEELEAYLSEEGNTIDLTLEADVAAGDEVFVMVFKEGKWQLIENVVNNGDGTITCTFEHFCPVAILTVPAEGADAEAPAIADADNEKGGFPWWIVLIVVLVAAVVVIVITTKRAQQKRKAARRNRVR